MDKTLRYEKLCKELKCNAQSRWKQKHVGKRMSSATWPAFQNAGAVALESQEIHILLWVHTVWIQNFKGFFCNPVTIRDEGKGIRSHACLCDRSPGFQSLRAPVVGGYPENARYFFWEHSFPLVESRHSQVGGNCRWIYRVVRDTSNSVCREDIRELKLGSQEEELESQSIFEMRVGESDLVKRRNATTESNRGSLARETVFIIS